MHNFTQQISIERIVLNELFGQYSYDIGPLGRSPILYGENGIGKTNILKILFHLLSPAAQAHHRTELLRIEFQSIYVYFSNGIVVDAIREVDGHEVGLRTSVKRGGHTLGVWHWGDVRKGDVGRLRIEAGKRLASISSSKEKKREFERVLMQQMERESDPAFSEHAFLNALETNVPPIYLLAADRIMKSDAMTSSTQWRMRSDLKADQMLEAARQNALNAALNTASDALSHLAFQATLSGNRSVHSTYRDLFLRLAQRSLNLDAEDGRSIEQLSSSLRMLSDRYDLYAEYGLTEKIFGDDLSDVLRKIAPENKTSALDILEPYVQSLAEHSNSLEPLFKLIDNVISTINDFLYDKQASFLLGDGISIINRFGKKIDPGILSSGEQQLLLLFCHIIIARTSPGIFIIDEPEISLNIKWQRKLVNALLQLDSDENLQFVLASHSMEILAKHRDCVIPLEGKRKP